MTTETKQSECKRKGCGQPVTETTWPGNLGYHSAICLSLDEIEASTAETVRRMHNLSSLLGYRRVP